MGKHGWNEVADLTYKEIAFYVTAAMSAMAGTVLLMEYFQPTSNIIRAIIILFVITIISGFLMGLSIYKRKHSKNLAQSQNPS